MKRTLPVLLTLLLFCSAPVLRAVEDPDVETTPAPAANHSSEPVLQDIEANEPSNPPDFVTPTEPPPASEESEAPTESTQAALANGETEAPEEVKATSPQEPSGPRRLDFPAVPNVLLEDPLPHRPPPSPPQQMGDRTGPVYIGHRTVIEKYAGWGWIRPENQSWRSAQWASLQETLGEIEAPGRYTRHPESDVDVQYRLFGEFTGEKVYEPNVDIFIPVFKLKGFERIGPAARPNLSPPRGQAPTRSRPTTGGARTNPFNR